MCTLYIPVQWAGLHTPTTPQNEKYKWPVPYLSEYLWSFVGRKAEATVNFLPLGCGGGVGWGGLRGGGGGGGEAVRTKCNPQKIPKSFKVLPAVESQLSQVRIEGKKHSQQRIFVYIHWERKLYAKIFLLVYYCMMKLFMRKLSNSSHFIIISWSFSLFPKFSKGERNFSPAVSNI